MSRATANRPSPPRVSRVRVLAAILRKDAMLFSRDWLFLALTVLSMGIFIGLYFVLPAQVDQSISLAVRGQSLQPAFEELAAEQNEGEALGISFYETTEELRQAIESGKSEIGIDFPPGFVESISSGDSVTVTVFSRPSLPPEFSSAVSTMVREIALALAGYELPVSEPTEESVVVGPAVGPIPLRDQLKPLYAFMILILEALALGTLIASEIQQRTASAILATPASTTDLLLSKTILGTLIAFSEAMIVMIVIRGLGPQPLAVVAALFLGAILVTGIAMISGAAGKDMVGTMLLGMLFLLPLAVPAFSVLFPGSTAGWVTFVPTHGLVNAIVQSTVYGAGWAEISGDLLALAGWGAVSLFVGSLILSRRVRNL